MADPNPTSASQTNIEIGVSSDSLIMMSNNAVRNVAAVSVDQTFTSTGPASTITIPVGVTHMNVYIWGGGGGALRTLASVGANSSGGGGGSFIHARIAVGSATTYTVTVGAGGLAGGGNGGASTLTLNGINYIAGGGTGGTTTAAGSGGTVSYVNGSANVVYAQNGFNGERRTFTTVNTSGGSAGGQIYGGGVGSATSVTSIIPGAGGSVVTNIARSGARGQIFVTYDAGQIDFNRIRAGINFPGRYLEKIGEGISNISNYNRSNAAVLSARSATISGTIVANTTFTINSNGAIYYDCFAAGQIRHQVNWLTYGTNNEYTANFTLISGSVTGSLTGTDLNLSTTRSWSLQSTATNTIRNDEDVALAVLSIKYNGVEILKRRVNLNTGASSG